MSNYAAWFDDCTKPLRYAQAPKPKPGKDQVVVANRAIAVNPVDWKIQDGTLGFYVPEENRPGILGEDCAGIVQEIGEGVINVKVGDRVMAHSQMLVTKNAQEGTFQQFTLVPAAAVVRIPDSLSFEDAAVLPLGISTASHALFGKDHLNLSLPTVVPTTDNKNKVVLVWGGASSVGICAVQLAKNAGYSVVTTASSHNVNFCKTHGANEVIDYNQNDAEKQVVEAIKKLGTLEGVVDAIALEPTFKSCATVAKELSSKVHISGSLPPPKDLDHPASGVFACFIFTEDDGKLGKTIWQDYLEEALQRGDIAPLPKAEVVGSLEKDIMKGLEKQQKASGRKIVLTV